MPVQPVHVGVLVVYLVFMVGVGLWFSRSTVMATGNTSSSPAATCPDR